MWADSSELPAETQRLFPPYETKAKLSLGKEFFKKELPASGETRKRCEDPYFPGGL